MNEKANKIGQSSRIHVTTLSKKMVRQNGVSSNSDKVQAVLSELEEWEAILKAEPELIHKLREFEQAAKPEVNAAPRRSGPKLRGPSL